MFSRLLIFVIIFITVGSNAYAKVYTVKYGDTLYGMLSNKFSSTDISSIASEISEQYSEFILKAGMKYLVDDNSLTIKADIYNDIIISYDELGVPSVTVNKYKEEIITVIISGEIKNNLFDTVVRNGESAELASQLATIFEWEIDFLRDIRNGDKYHVLVEKKFVNNKYAGYGKIVAADFINQGKMHRAIYFDEGKNKGYYTPKGEGLERGFLRVPLNYSRISSRFSGARFHPVLKVVRPHYGVDYAARSGTPIMATAAGVVEKKAYDKGNGNYVVLRHSNGYQTYYLHMRGFHKNLRVGADVDQGQVIGYVGSTGYSTGPHLDYRIRKNGSWINPLTFRATPKTLTIEELQKFMLIAEIPNKTLDRAYYIVNAMSENHIMNRISITN